MSTNSDNTEPPMLTGVFMDPGTLLTDPSSNVIIPPPYDLSDPRIQLAWNHALDADTRRLIDVLAEDPPPPPGSPPPDAQADPTWHPVAAAAPQDGSDASTASTDSATSMSTSATTETSDATISPLHGPHPARVTPAAAAQSPSTPPRLHGNPFDLPRLRPPGAPLRVRIPSVRRLRTERDYVTQLTSRRRASSEREGNVSFLSRRNNIPVICINVENSWRWVPFHELPAPDFIKYRDQISSYLGRLQSRARSNDVYTRNQHHQKITIHLPSPDERAFLKMLFNNHLEDHEKRRYIIEFSHTIIGDSHCSGCLKLTLKDKVKCIHYDCPGMCEECAAQIGDSCPICEKAQLITCPICKDEKEKGEIGFAPSGCGHAVCWACMGKAYQVNARGLRKCPQCREPWHKPR